MRFALSRIHSQYVPSAGPPPSLKAWSRTSASWGCSWSPTNCLVTVASIRASSHLIALTPKQLRHTNSVPQAEGK